MALLLNAAKIRFKKQAGAKPQYAACK